MELRDLPSVPTSSTLSVVHKEFESYPIEVDKDPKDWDHQRQQHAVVAPAGDEPALEGRGGGREGGRGHC